MSDSIPDNIISTFGGIPNLINKNLTHFKVEGNNYFCNLCETVVCSTTADKSTTITCFNNHIEGPIHDGKNTERQRCIDDFKIKVKEVGYNTLPKRDIPPIIFINLPFLSRNNQNNSCTLCNETLVDIVEHFPVEGENLVVRHLLSVNHRQKVKEFHVKCNQVKVQLENVCGKIPPPIIDYNEFKRDTNDAYQCTVCMVTFSQTDMRSNEKFLNHLCSADHKKKVDQHRVKVTAPELARLFNTEQIPYYMVNNIEYVRPNRSSRLNVFCSLCNISILPSNLKTPSSRTLVYEAQQQLKYHFLSDDHEKQFFKKLDHNNECYRRLHQIFESFPVPVQKDLKCLGLNENNNFCCLSCDIEIIIENDPNDTKNNILAHFFPGVNNIEFSVHKEKENGKRSYNDKVKADLNKVFRSIPDKMQKNIVFPNRFVSASPEEENYLCCNICEDNEKFRLDDENTILRHLSSEKHRCNFQYHTESNSDNTLFTETKLLEHFTPPFQAEVYPIPKFIQENLVHLSFEGTSEFREYDYTYCFPDYSEDYRRSKDDENNYRKQKKSEEQEKDRVKGKNLVCNICNGEFQCPSVILFGKSPHELDVEDSTEKLLNRKQTEYNLRTHFLSKGHKLNIQRNENKCFNALTILEQLFRVIPCYARNNIHQMVAGSRLTKRYICNFCSRDIECHDAKRFEEHFIDSTSWTETEHQIKETESEQSHSAAMYKLQMMFPPVPRVVLRNLDFLRECEANLFCDLCEETLFIENLNLEETRSYLCLHMRSKKHMVVLDGVRIAYDVPRYWEE